MRQDIMARVWMSLSVRESAKQTKRHIKIT